MGDKVNRGKDFENVIRDCTERVYGTTVYRLQDSMGGFSGVANICDFIVYKYPMQFFWECKSHYGNTFPISNITPRQYEGMRRMSEVNGVAAGVILWFIDHDLTVYIPIQAIVNMRVDNTRSIRYDNLPAEAIVIEGKKKRIFFEYNIKKLLEEIKDRWL